MAEQLKVKGYTGLVRDVYSSAIIREKSNDYEMYMQRQIQIRENKDEINTINRILRIVKLTN